MNYSFYDELDELDEILEETTDEETFLETMMDLLGLNDPKYGVFMEKEDSIDYKIRSFKKRYDFHKTDKKGLVGAILINGIPVYVDLDINNYDTDYERDVSSVYIDGVHQNILVLNRSFFVLNKKDQDALIQHEMGHMRLKPGQPSIQTANNRITDNLIEKWIQDLSKRVEDKYNQGEIDEDEFEEIQEDIQNKMKTRIERLYNKKVTNPNMEKIRDEIYDYADQYAKNLAKKYKFSVKGLTGVFQSTHFDVDEMEADRYAANHASEKQVTRAIINYNKQEARSRNKSRMRKDINQARYDANMSPITDSEFDSVVSKNNKEHAADYMMRKKALSDNNMKHSRAYKNI